MEEMEEKTDISVDFAGLRLANPVFDGREVVS
jgi:hypothetical protein